MAKLPKTKPKTVFDRELDGVLGSFATVDSYQVQYLQTSAKLSKALDHLAVAAEAFPFSSIDFEEMVQRDVDYGRVRNIVTKYLQKGKGRVLFFPPLIVAVVATDEGKPKALYDDVVTKPTDEDKSEFQTTYDGDKFRVQVNTAEHPTGHVMQYANENYNYYNYATTLAWNPDKVKMVVIDGQHRFEALRGLHKADPEGASDIEIPLCVVYTPDAVKGHGSEDILKDLREMFVTINTTAKEVSGHFIELLKDQSLASISVRELADYWKSSDTRAWRSKLHLLEWNERSDSRSRTVQRDYAVTTISILADVLREHLYTRRREGVIQDILRLSFVKDELEQAAESPRFDQIDEEKFIAEQESTLRIQIREYVVPSLDALFSYAAPYRRLWEGVESALDEVDRKAESGASGYRVFRIEILGQFRRWESHKDSDAAKDAQDEFDSMVSEIDVPAVLFLNVFQQAYVRVWIELSRRMITDFDIGPRKTATLLVKIYEAMVFDRADVVFGSAQTYAHRVLYVNGKPNLYAWGKQAWANIAGSVLSSERVDKSLRGAVDADSELALQDEQLAGIINDWKLFGSECLLEYEEELRHRIQKDIRSNWRVKEYDRGLIVRLTQLAESTDSDEQAKFEEEIERLVEEAFQEARHQLYTTFHIKQR